MPASYVCPHPEQCSTIHPLFSPSGHSVVRPHKCCFVGQFLPSDCSQPRTRSLFITEFTICLVEMWPQGMWPLYIATNHALYQLFGVEEDSFFLRYNVLLVSHWGLWDCRNPTDETWIKPVSSGVFTVTEQTAPVSSVSLTSVSVTLSCRSSVSVSRWESRKIYQIKIIPAEEIQVFKDVSVPCDITVGCGQS